MDKFHSSKFDELVGEDNIFLSVADAVRTCAPSYQQVWLLVLQGNYCQVIKTVSCSIEFGWVSQRWTPSIPDRSNNRTTQNLIQKRNKRSYIESSLQHLKQNQPLRKPSLAILKHGFHYISRAATPKTARRFSSDIVRKDPEFPGNGDGADSLPPGIGDGDGAARNYQVFNEICMAESHPWIWNCHLKPNPS